MFAALGLQQGLAGYMRQASVHVTVVDIPEASVAAVTEAFASVVAVTAELDSLGNTAAVAVLHSVVSDTLTLLVAAGNPMKVERLMSAGDWALDNWWSVALWFAVQAAVRVWS